jgi:hypothetical protein
MALLGCIAFSCISTGQSSLQHLHGGDPLAAGFVVGNASGCGAGKQAIAASPWDSLPGNLRHGDAFAARRLDGT